MPAIDNSALIAPFMPDEDDGDTFLYTEILDRRKRTGNNSARQLRIYYHRCRAHFEEQLPEIRHVSEAMSARAYTRLSPRSLKAVGKLHATLVLQHVLEQQWNALRYAYASACGRVTPKQKLWLFDVDEPTTHTYAFQDWLKDHDLLVAVIPSRKGHHLIAKPYDLREGIGFGTTLHKDNPSNLYIPEGAA